MNKNDQFDLVVIGAGTGALGVARACAQAGWKVAIVDCLPHDGPAVQRGWRVPENDQEIPMPVMGDEL